MTTFNKKLLLDAVRWVREAAESKDRSAPINLSNGRMLGTMDWAQGEWMSRDAGVLESDAEEYEDSERASLNDIEEAKIVEEIEPDCGTACCVAGYVAVRRYRPTNLRPVTLAKIYEKVEAKHHVGYGEPGHDYELTAWHHFGMEALGIDRDEALRLFHYNNTAADVEHIANEIIANHEGARA